MQVGEDGAVCDGGMLCCAGTHCRVPLCMSCLLSVLVCVYMYICLAFCLFSSSASKTC